jgi:hypothetical protein
MEAPGRCLCGEVRYLAGRPKVAAHCHCAYCRLAHGAAFVTWVVLADAEFRLVAGESVLRWRRSSEPSERAFCSGCGSPLFFRSRLCPGEIHVTRASLPAEYAAPVTYTCFVEHEVPWGKTGAAVQRVRGDGPELAHYRTIPPP